MKKKLSIAIMVLGTIMLLGACRKTDKKIDIVAGASQIPLANEKYIAESKVTGRYFLRIAGEDKFIGYNAQYDIDKNNYYKMRVTGPGPDKKWFTSDDQINKYYKITTDENNNIIVNSEYSENSDKGIAYFGENDELSEMTKVIEFNGNNQPTKVEIYKGTELSGYETYTYDNNGKLVESKEFDSADKNKAKSILTYREENNEVIRRETRYKGDKLKDWREMHIVDGKDAELVKYDGQGNITATEKYDSIKQSF